MIAILHGLEVGLTPLMALQRIAVIDGRPTIWGDGAMALVRASGLCRSVREWVTGRTPEAWTARCEVLREGDARPVARSFSVVDAKRADLWGKPGPWSSFPRRMLQMRARAFALRDVFADVLGGLYLREELEEPALSPVHCEPPAMNPMGHFDSAPEAPIPPAPRPTREERRPARTRGSSWVRPRAPRDGIRLRAPAPPEFEATKENAGPPSGCPLTHERHASERDTLDLLDDALCCAQDEESLRDIEEDFAARLEALTSDATAEADRIRAQHARRVQDLAKGGTP